MNSGNTDNRLHEDILARIGQRRLSEALDLVETLPSADASMTDEVRHLREAYRLLAEYSLDGVADPTRAGMYEQLATGVVDLADNWLRRRRAIDRPTLYYNTVRYESTRPSDTITSLLEEVMSIADNLGLALLSGQTHPIDEQTGRPMRRRMEDAWVRAFNRIWVQYPLSADDENALQAALASPRMPAELRPALLSAVTLGALEWYDERRMALLADACEGEDVALTMRALSGLMTARWRHRQRPLGRRTRLRIEALADNPRWYGDVRTVGMQLIAARDTERITRKIRDEFIPELMKLRPEISRRMAQEGLLDLSQTEENPEWEKMLHDSGLEKKLKEFASLQEEGGDVMMASFSHLKNFPFFNDVANWMLPFTADHTAVVESTGERWQSFARVMELNQFLCDSDKYSLACAFKMVPDGQLEAFQAQFEQQAREESAQILSPDRENAARNYVRVLYRFFKLFRRKGEFPDPFATPFNPALLTEFAPAFADAETMRLVAEFYFRRGYWEDAAQMLRLLAETAPDAVTYQKIGHAEQQVGHFEEAAQAYLQADLLSHDDPWTLRRLGVVNRILGRHEAAFEAFTRLEALRPDDPVPALNRGMALMALKKFSEALPSLFKAEFLSSKRPELALRPLAWALTLTGDLERAAQYHDRIPEAVRQPVDLLNRAHLAMLAGDNRRAVELYADTLESLEFDSETFAADLRADTPLLIERGVDPLTLDIVIDRALEASRRRGSRLNQST